MADPLDVIAMTLNDHGVDDADRIAGAVLASLQGECYEVIDPLKLGNAIIALAARHRDSG